MLTIEQLKLLAACKVPIQEKYGFEWYDDDSEDCSWGFCCSPENPRVKPGATFGGAIAAKLKEAGVPLENNFNGGGSWWPELPTDAAPHEGDCFTYRVTGTGIEQPDRPEHRAPFIAQNYLVLNFECNLIEARFATLAEAEAKAKAMAEDEGCRYEVLQFLCAYKCEPTAVRVEV
jgi:hypothetical protein